MNDCPSPENAADCKPVGSPPPGDPCTPCFDDDRSLQAQVSEALKQLCAVSTQITNFGQLLGKFRNRLNRIEDTLAHLPKPTAQVFADPCAVGDETDDADAILVCSESSQKLFKPSEDECESISSKDGLWKVIPKGLSFYKLDTPQSLILGANTNLTDYDIYSDIGCDLWALIEIQDFVTGNSATGGTFLFTANGRLIGAEYLVNGGGDCTAGQGMCRLTENKLTIAITTSASGSPVHSSTSYKLIGYFA